MKCVNFDQFLSDFCRALPYGLGPATNIQIEKLKSVFGHSIPPELESIVRKYGNTGIDGIIEFDSGRKTRSISSIFNASEPEEGSGMIDHYLERPEYKDLGFLPFADDGIGGVFIWCCHDGNVLHVDFTDLHNEYIAEKISDSFYDFIMNISSIDD